MMGLPDGAVRDVSAEDFQQCLVVRVGDEFVVDLMRQACGIDFAEASRYVGELYFQAHRGTYTSQAATKRRRKSPTGPQVVTPPLKMPPGFCSIARAVTRPPSEAPTR